ncbi:uncharacterized protein LOC123559248 [Mercenaria mercenaria]|uniref:uncharacterized protein LOC123559248 n=1 Tax=Mercenaria mercenaria TaxID=6596 RepID=UPI00234E692B|nr:uncharacterized protein LOC123559248 [Mercenaria mercenaria]
MNMFITKVILLAIVTCASGASVNLDSSNLQAIVTEVVRNILSDGHSGENIKTVALLKEINELKNQHIRLEQRIDMLEQEQRDKDTNICSLQNNMNTLVEMIARNDSIRAQNLTIHTSHELLNKCRAWKSNVFPTENSRIETLQRKKREVIPTQAPARRIAFSAYLTHTHSGLSPGQAIKFDHVLLNEGHGYNPYLGDFVAPISGTYLFTFHFHSRVHTFVRLTVDGVNIVDAVANPHTGTHDKESMSGNTVIIHVGIGQAVLVEVYDVSGEAASSDKYRLCSFSGFLLYPENPS